MKKTPLFAILATAAFALVLSACAANSANLSGTNWKLATYGPKVAQTAAASDIDTNLAFDNVGAVDFPSPSNPAIRGPQFDPCNGATYTNAGGATVRSHCGLSSNGNFGHMSGSRGPREIQFGIKLSF